MTDIKRGYRGSIGVRANVSSGIEGRQSELADPSGADLTGTFAGQ
jgi:hypothetical protein